MQVHPMMRWRHQEDKDHGRLGHAQQWAHGGESTDRQRPKKGLVSLRDSGCVTVPGGVGALHPLPLGHIFDAYCPQGPCLFPCHGQGQGHGVFVRAHRGLRRGFAKEPVALCAGAWHCIALCVACMSVPERPERGTQGEALGLRIAPQVLPWDDPSLVPHSTRDRRRPIPQAINVCLTSLPRSTWRRRSAQRSGSFWVRATIRGTRAAPGKGAALVAGGRGPRLRLPVPSEVRCWNPTSFGVRLGGARRSPSFGFRLHSRIHDSPSVVWRAFVWPLSYSVRGLCFALHCMRSTECLYVATGGHAPVVGTHPLPRWLCTLRSVG